MRDDTPNRPASPRSLAALTGLWPFLRPYRARIALAFVLLCLGSGTILLVPLAFRDLIDFGFGKPAQPSGGLLGALSLNGHFIALFGLACIWALAVAARYYTVSWIGERATADLRSAVYARVLSQSPQFFETLQTGEVLSRLTGDTTLIQTVVGSSISMGLRSLFQFVGGMIMLAVTSLYLFSLNLGLMALLTLPILAIGRKVRKLSRESQDKIADASALAGEILNAMPDGAGLYAGTAGGPALRRAHGSQLRHRDPAHARARRAHGAHHHRRDGNDHLRAVDRRPPGARRHPDRRPASLLRPLRGAGGRRRRHAVGSVGRRDARGRGDGAAARLAARRIGHPRGAQPANADAAGPGGDPLRACQRSATRRDRIIRRSTTSASTSRRAKASRWSAPPAPARARCSSCCCASTRFRRGDPARRAGYPPTDLQDVRRASPSCRRTR